MPRAAEFVRLVERGGEASNTAKIEDTHRLINKIEEQLKQFTSRPLQQSQENDEPYQQERMTFQTAHSQSQTPRYGSVSFNSDEICAFNKVSSNISNNNQLKSPRGHNIHTLPTSPSRIEFSRKEQSGSNQLTQLSSAIAQGKGAKKYSSNSFSAATGNNQRRHEEGVVEDDYQREIAYLRAELSDRDRMVAECRSDAQLLLVSTREEFEGKLKLMMSRFAAKEETLASEVERLTRMNGIIESENQQIKSKYDRLVALYTRLVDFDKQRLFTGQLLDTTAFHAREVAEITVLEEIHRQRSEETRKFISSHPPLSDTANEFKRNYSSREAVALQFQEDIPTKELNKTQGKGGNSRSDGKKRVQGIKETLQREAEYLREENNEDFELEEVAAATDMSMQSQSTKARAKGHSGTASQGKSMAVSESQPSGQLVKKKANR